MADVVVNVDSQSETENPDGCEIMRERDRLLGHDVPLLNFGVSPNYTHMAGHQERTFANVNSSGSAREMPSADLPANLDAEASPVPDIHCHTLDEPHDTVACKQLLAVSVLCTIFMIAEIVGMKCPSLL